MIRERCQQLIVCAALVAWSNWPAAASAAGSPPQRIISVVPAATEMLFALGAGPRVVAVSSFDEHPAEVARLPRVGALLDPDLERILTLRPDLVVVYESQTDLREQLERAGIATFVYTHGGLADITQTLRALGDRVGLAESANQVARGIEERLESIRIRTASRPHPRTLLVFGRDPLTLRNVDASGGIGFLHDILELAGGTNVFGDITRQSVQATTENMLGLAPEVIVELKYTGKLDADTIERERTAWSILSSVPAVRTGRVHLLIGDEFVVPGPRIAIAAERLARKLHPEAFADRSRDR